MSGFWNIQRWLLLYTAVQIFHIRIITLIEQYLILMGSHICFTLAKSNKYSLVFLLLVKIIILTTVFPLRNPPADHWALVSGLPTYVAETGLVSVCWAAFLFLGLRVCAPILTHFHGSLWNEHKLSNSVCVARNFCHMTELSVSFTQHFYTLKHKKLQFGILCVVYQTLQCSFPTCCFKVTALQRNMFW